MDEQAFGGAEKRPYQTPRHLAEIQEGKQQMISRTEGRKHRTSAWYFSIIGLLLLGAVSLLAVAGQACGGSSLPDSALNLIPEDASVVVIWDVQLILKEAPREYQDAFEDVIDAFGDIAAPLYNLTTMVGGQIDGEELLVLEGGFDIEQIQNELDDADYDDERYRGYEIWRVKIGWQSQWWALIEDRGQVVIGNIEVVKSVLRALDRGSGSLLDDPDNNVARVLKKAGHGWATTAETGCDALGLRSCRAAGTTIARDKEDHLINVTFAVLFEDKRAVESQIDDLDEDLDEFLGDIAGHANIEEVREDGEFVLITITMDEEALSDGFGFFP